MAYATYNVPLSSSLINATAVTRTACEVLNPVPTFSFGATVLTANIQVVQDNCSTFEGWKIAVIVVAVVCGIAGAIAIVVYHRKTTATRTANLKEELRAKEMANYQRF
jgi:anti-sigma-K factor RskA